MQIYNEILNILEDTKYDDISYSGDIRGYEIRLIANKIGSNTVIDYLISILLDKTKKIYWRRAIKVIWESDLDRDYLLGSGRENNFIAILLYCSEFLPELKFYSREDIWPYISLFKDVCFDADSFPKDDEDYTGHYRYYNPYEDDDIIKELEFLQNKYGK